MSQTLPSTALTADAASASDGTGYPAPFREHCEGLRRCRLGDAAGLTQFGVNLLVMQPGQWSAQRHWHTHEDELVCVLEGEVVLVSDAGEQTLGPGQFAGFPAGRADGHHLVNRSQAPATLLEVGSRRDEDECHYPDIDLHFRNDADGAPVYTRKNGERY